MGIETFDIIASNRGVYAPCQVRVDAGEAVVVRRGESYISVRAVYRVGFVIEVMMRRGEGEKWLRAHNEVDS